MVKDIGLENTLAALRTIKSNAEIFATYISENDIKSAETILELLCLQIKIYLSHDLYCTVNRDSLKARLIRTISTKPPSSP